MSSHPNVLNVSESSVVNERERQEIEVVVPLEFARLASSVSTVCRTCLAASRQLTSLFIDATDDRSPAKMLSAFAAIQPTYGDGLPENICQECAESIEKCYSFKQLCEKSESILQCFIEQGNIEGLKLEPVMDILPSDLENYTNDDGDSTLNDKSKLEAVTCDVFFGNDYRQSSPEIKLNSINLKSTENRQPVPTQIARCNSMEIDNTDMDLIESSIGSPKSSEKNVKKKMKKKNKKKCRDISIDENGVREDEVERKLCLIIDNRSPEKSNECVLKEVIPKKKTSKNVLICGWCGKQFPNQHRLTRHERTHQDNKNYSCPTCQKGFNEFRDYHRHILSYKKQEEKTQNSDINLSFPCQQCHMKFSSEADLRIHSSIHMATGDKRVCQHCKKEFSTIMQLKRHVRTHLLDKPHKCNVCQKGFPEMGSLTRHYRRHTAEIRERKHICKICNKAYYDRHSLNIHERRHTGEKPWECTECGRRFIDSRLLNSHMKTHSDLKPHACNICDKTFRHESTLTTHKRTHTGEKPYVCSVCGNAFVQSSNLSLHMRTHTREKPYICEHCPKKFSSSSALTAHVRTHTGEKPYVCSICSKRFARRDMKAHMRTHTGEKPFTCSICNRRFITPGQLQQHIRIHTGERPFTCNICGKGCTTSCYLKKHMVKTHNILNLAMNNKVNIIKNSGDCLLTPKLEVKSESPDIVIATNQVLNISSNSLALNANDLNVVTVANSSSELNDLGLTTCISPDDQMVTTEVGTIVTNALITDDKLYQIDPRGLLRIHQVSTTNLVSSRQITLNGLTNTSH